MTRSRDAGRTAGAVVVEGSGIRRSRMGGDQGHVAIRLDPNPSRRQTILWPSIFKLRTSRRALCVATLSLQREHRRRLRVFGRVLDVIDADCLTKPRPRDEGAIWLFEDQRRSGRRRGELPRRGAGDEQRRSSRFPSLPLKPNEGRLREEDRSTAVDASVAMSHIRRRWAQSLLAHQKEAALWPSAAAASGK
jgi:hypothetical protein